MQDSKTTELMRQELWQEYWKKRDVNLRNQLAVEYMSIVRYYVYNLRSTYENYAEASDMLNQGCLALMEAVEKYNPGYNTKFESYASIRIKGAIIDYVRKQDWVPKRAKHEGKQFGEAMEELAVRLGHMPTNEEMAEHLGISVKEVEKILGEIYTFNLLSYEELLEQGLYGAKGYRESAQGQQSEPEQEMQSEELKTILSQYLDELPEKERLILTLYYYEELKIKEIAYILDVSSSRVCQLHTAALQKMKKKLMNYLSEEE
jgi:RNA polymerase sigma factor for flagellar operon FliA